MQRLGRHELAHQRRLAGARGPQHGYAERLCDAWTTGATRLSGRRQRRARAGPRRTRVGAAPAPAATRADHRVVGGGQVFRAERHKNNNLNNCHRP